MAVLRRLSLEFEIQCDCSPSMKRIENPFAIPHNLSHTETEIFTDIWSCCCDLWNATLGLQLAMDAGANLPPETTIPMLSRPRTMAHELSTR